MSKLGFISCQECMHAQELAVCIIETQSNQCNLHVKELIRQFLEPMLGKEALYTGGFSIQTTINKHAQEQAEIAFQKQITKLKTTLTKEIDGALLAIDTHTGAIKALIGGLDFSISQFNRTKARRQLGSVIKPLIYAAALEQGMHFAHTAIDEPIEVTLPDATKWAPNNYNYTFQGEVTLAYALSHSNNIIPIKLLLHIGYDRVLEMIKQCNVQAALYAYPSLALGCIDTTLYEAAGIFNIFANNGMYVEPYIITFVQDQWGKKIWRHNSRQQQVMKSTISGQVNKVLQLSFERFIRFSKKKPLQSQVISKTGTTNQSRTCWFVGATPTLTTAVYVGCDDNRSLGINVYPIQTAFPLWYAFNAAVPSSTQIFALNPLLQEVTINERTGKITDKKSPHAITIAMEKQAYKTLMIDV